MPNSKEQRRRIYISYMETKDRSVPIFEVNSTAHGTSFPIEFSLKDSSSHLPPFYKSPAYIL